MECSELKAKFEACGVTNLHAEHAAQCIVEDHLDCIDNGDCCDPCCPDGCDTEPAEEPKGKAKKAKGKEGEASVRATPGTLRDMVNEARAKSIPWVTILSLLLKGLEFLKDFLNKQPEPTA